MSEKAFSIVMPIKLRNIDLDLQRLFEINLASLDKFFDKSILSEIMLVASAGDLNRISDRTMQMPLVDRVRLVDESDLCTCFKSMTGNGWFRQQVIKIAAAGIASTKYLIAYDDDVVMTKHASFDDFTFEGQLIMSHIPMTAHPQFIESSCAVLDYPMKNYFSGEIVMNVTPEILVTDVLLGLQREIESVWGVKDFAAWLLRLSAGYFELPRTRLLERVYHRCLKNRIHRREQQLAKLRRDCGNWTEYSLYWTFLKKKNLTHYYYNYNQDRRAPQMGDRGIWTNEEAENLDLDQWIEEVFDLAKRHYFAVFSAKITNVDRQQLYDKIKKRLNDQP